MPTPRRDAYRTAAMPLNDLTISLALTELDELRRLSVAVRQLLAFLDATRQDRPEIQALRDAVAAITAPDDRTSDSWEPVHDWFELSYANYLVLHRTLLQQMPVGWQRRFVRCLEELRDAPWSIEPPNRFRVTPIDERGRFTHDPIPHYRHGFVPTTDTAS